MLAELLEFLLHGNNCKQAVAYNCECRKALLQVALDQGKWATAIHLIPTADPIAKSMFGGEEEELVWVHGCRKATTDLKTKAMQKMSGEMDEEGQPTGEAAGKENNI